jgi:hypothetical protein
LNAEHGAAPRLVAHELVKRDHKAAERCAYGARQVAALPENAGLQRRTDSRRGDESAAATSSCRSPHRGRRLHCDHSDPFETTGRTRANDASRLALVRMKNRVGPVPDAWQATRAQTALATQFAPDENAYLAPGTADIGTAVSATERELFVSCEPALALEQQFEHLRPQFIAVHDIATASSRGLLSGIATASGRPMQSLVIRRQGYGTVLANLPFVQLPADANTTLRIYATEAHPAADAAAQAAVAYAMLGFSQLAVMIVGDLPAAAMAAALRPLREKIASGPWPNRQLLLLPLSSAATLAAETITIGRGNSINVRTTPQVLRPADAWNFINATWSRLQGAAVPSTPAVGASYPVGAGSAPTASGAGTADRLPMRPMPSLRNDPAEGAESNGALDRYVQQVSKLAGMVGCCIFDIATGRDVAHAGAGPDPAELARQGSALLASLGTAAGGLGLGHAVPEAMITYGVHHLLLRALPRYPGLALHAVLDKTQANPTLARLQIERLDGGLAA